MRSAHPPVADRYDPCWSSKLLGEFPGPPGNHIIGSLAHYGTLEAVLFSSAIEPVSSARTDKKGVMLMRRKRTARAPLGSLSLFAVVLASGANAASQGTVKAASSGSVGISLSVQPRARISGLKDIEFSAADSVERLRSSQEICVFSNSLARSYAVSAVGSGPSGSLELSSGTRSIGYSVEWSPGAEPGSNTRLSPGLTLPGPGAAAAEPDCRSGRGLAHLVVGIDPERLHAEGLEGSYTGTLTLYVTPL